jgi:uncharacterized membrane protein
MGGATLTFRVNFRHDLLVLSGLSLLLVPITGFSQGVALRIALGLLHIMFIPGYALVSALFVGRDELKWIERLGLSFALSIPMVSLTGLFLNYTRWGIRLAPLLVALTSVVLMCCIAAYWRRRKLSPAERFVLCFEIGVPRWQKLGRLDRLLALVLTLSVLTVIVAVIYAAGTPGPADAFTEFYVLGLDQRLGGHPTEVSVNSPVTITLNVVNHEHAEMQYRIEYRESQNSTWIASPKLGHGGTWKQPYTFALTQPGENRPVTFLLYKQDDEKPYRSLHLWITVREELPQA